MCINNCSIDDLYLNWLLSKYYKMCLKSLFNCGPDLLILRLSVILFRLLLCAFLHYSESKFHLLFLSGMQGITA